jgi:hypothetical protein
MTEAENPIVASVEYRRIGALPRRELEALIVRGQTPDPTALAGWEYRGMNTPRWAGLAGIRKFIKGFYRAEDGVRGYNLPVVQDRLDAPWRPKRARPFGFYRVVTVDPTARDNHYLHALLLDYGRGGNPRLDPSRTLRDYLVRVRPGSDELLLGKAFVAVGPARLAVSYFVLERLRPAEHTGPA